VQLALELLLVGELGAALEETLLGTQMGGVGAYRLRSRGRVWTGTVARHSPRGFGDLQAGHETFKIALLLGLEVAAHRLS
jgi:hypothetical protein